VSLRFVSFSLATGQRRYYPLVLPVSDKGDSPVALFVGVAQTSRSGLVENGKPIATALFHSVSKPVVIAPVARPVWLPASNQLNEWLEASGARKLAWTLLHRSRIVQPSGNGLRLRRRTKDSLPPPE
jgi:hypothetical protein